MGPTVGAAPFALAVSYPKLKQQAPFFSNKNKFQHSPEFPYCDGHVVDIKNGNRTHRPKFAES